MKTIKLYGHLGKRFGKIHRYDVRTPAEAIRALMGNFPDFRAHVLKHNEPGYRVIVGSDDRSSAEEMYFPADADTIKIIPVIAGSSGVFKVIVGVALIVVGVVITPFFPNLGPALVKVGIGLTISGIAQLLFAPPKPEARDAEEEKGSELFNGPINLSAQNNPVPLAYGQIMIGSQVIYARIKTTKVAI